MAPLEGARPRLRTRDPAVSGPIGVQALTPAIADRDAARPKRKTKDIPTQLLPCRGCRMLELLLSFHSIGDSGKGRPERETVSRRWSWRRSRSTKKLPWERQVATIVSQEVHWRKPPISWMRGRPVPVKLRTMSSPLPTAFGSFHPREP